MAAQKIDYTISVICYLTFNSHEVRKKKLSYSAVMILPSQSYFSMPAIMFSPFTTVWNGTYVEMCSNVRKDYKFFLHIMVDMTL